MYEENGGNGINYFSILHIYIFIENFQLLFFQTKF